MIRIGMMMGDRYEILERIGTGGMSDVYKAKCHKLNRYVAVKVLKQEFSENTNFVAKFRAEAQAAASLMHPNIVNVYDVGEEHGVNYIVMELVEGITLKKYIEKKARLSFKEAVSIAIQACMGIEAAHKNRIIHRDIKPQNIIISKDGKVKVTDFGIAKAATSNTITSNVMGSVHYTSPEQARGGYSDEKSDIYSMGITLFEMLTGRVPFNGETTVAIAIKHIQEEMPSPREYVPEIPVSVEQIVLKCTQKSPDRRYHVVAELLDDLKRALMSPDEDFVRIESPDESGATRAVTDTERAQIKKQAKKKETADPEIRLKKNATRIAEKPAAKKKKVIIENVHDEERYGDDSKMERITTLLAIIGAVLIGCAVIFLVGRTVGVFDFSVTSQQISMVDVTGMSENEAVTRLKSMGLKPEVSYQMSDSIAVGKVISTDAVPGTKIAEGTRVLVVVSADQGGQKGIPVPDVLGVTEAEAVASLQQSGFVVEKAETFSDTVAKGRIISQFPEGGSKASSNSAVQIVISKGSDANNKILMPDILGLDPDTAVSVLIESGLSLGQQSDMNDADPARLGKVCYVSFTAGMPLDPGTVVDIGISVGPKAMTYAFTEHITSPADLDSSYIEGTECIVIITGQSGAEFYRTTVNSFPITTMNLHGLTDPAALITYLFVTEENATTVVGANGETVNIPGNRVTKTVQRQVLFTPEAG